MGERRAKVSKRAKLGAQALGPRHQMGLEPGPPGGPDVLPGIVEKGDRGRRAAQVAGDEGEDLRVGLGRPDHVRGVVPIQGVPQPVQVEHVRPMGFIGVAEAGQDEVRAQRVQEVLDAGIGRIDPGPEPAQERFRVESPSTQYR